MTTDTIADTRQHVVLQWDFTAGLRFVGPFADQDAAISWACYCEDTVTGSPCWHTEHLDPEAPIEIRPPRAAPIRLASPEDRRDSPAAGFFLLIPDPWLSAAPAPYLIGPYADQRMGELAGSDCEARSESDGWQLVWLDDPTARVPFLSPVEAEENPMPWD